MIVMWHKFDYLDQGTPRQKQSHMVLEGESTLRTAMAKTVGLPVGIAARLILQGRIPATGVQIPVRPEIYAPILEGLRPFGIEFHERQTDLR
jgi:saccharopine dehydrogenase (NADP+, L-glutamate forming)